MEVSLLPGESTVVNGTVIEVRQIDLFSEGGAPASPRVHLVITPEE